MKKYIILIAIISFRFTAKSASQIKDVDSNRVVITDTILTTLSALNIDTFNSKPVDSFLAKIPLGYSRIKLYGGDNPKIARKLIVSYPNDVFIKIIVDNFQFMNPKSETRTWDLTLFRKENISYIEIYNDVTCINGCFLPVDIFRHQQKLDLSN